MHDTLLFTFVKCLGNSNNQILTSRSLQETSIYTRSWLFHKIQTFSFYHLFSTRSWLFYKIQTFSFYHLFSTKFKSDIQTNKQTNTNYYIIFKDKQGELFLDKLKHVNIKQIYMICFKLIIILFWKSLNFYTLHHFCR